MIADDTAEEKYRSFLQPADPGHEAGRKHGFAVDEKTDVRIQRIFNLPFQPVCLSDELEYVFG